jgi:hypothetical protein
MPEAPKRLLFTITWHKVVLCAGLAALAFLTVIVPWKGHGYGPIWSPLGGGGVDVSRQAIPMLFVIVATGVGVYLTKGLAPWAVRFPNLIASHFAKDHGRPRDRSNDLGMPILALVGSVIAIAFFCGIASVWHMVRNSR